MNKEKSKSIAKKQKLIYIVAPLEEQVPPQNYGGIEGQIALLVNGLVARGFKICLFSVGSSKGLTDADKLVSVIDEPLRENLAKLDQVRSLHINKVAELAQIEKPDVVHTHMWTKALPSLVKETKKLNIPLVQTFHNGFEENDLEVFTKLSYPHYVAISENQSRILRESAPLIKHTRVYNGVDFNNEFAPETHRLQPLTLLKETEEWLDGRPYLAWVGRFNPQKGPHLAMELALKLNMPLVLAGKVSLDVPECKAYYEQKIKPYLTSEHFHLLNYIGLITPSQRQQLFQKAEAAVLPTQWQEPFGLTTVESMSVGTPVITCPFGASPEIVGETGGIVVNDMNEAHRRFDEVLILDRKGVKERAKRFSVDRMVDSYARLYDSVMHRHQKPLLTSREAEHVDA